MHKKKPNYLDLTKIRQSVTAVLSILHRITGVALFVGLPFLLWLLSSSLNQQESFETYQLVVTHPIGKILLLLFLWAFFHHLLAGVRFLFVDVGKGLNLKTAKFTAKIVLLSAPMLALIVGGCLLW